MKMRKWAVGTSLVVALLAGSGYWMLSGFTFGGTFAYDLNGPNPASERTKQSWRYRVGQVILPLVYDHDTRYSTGYKEASFQSLKMGVSQGDVRALLGEPLKKYQLEDGHWMWHYSEHGPKSKDYLVRTLEFGSDEHLLRKGAEFYVD
jgi:hypothetical protein